MDWLKRKQYSRPLPELLDGKDWEVRNSGNLKKAYVNFKKKEFVVPFTSGPAGELVRAHEAMHVKITPQKHSFSEADFVTYQSVEDARVNSALRTAGISTDKARVFSDTDIAKAYMDPDKRTPLRLGEAFFATKGLSEHSKVLETIEEIFPDRPEVKEICEEVFSKYISAAETSGEILDDEKTARCTFELKKKLDDISSPEEKESDKSNENKSGKGKKNLTQSWKPGAVDGDRFAEISEFTAEESDEAKEYLNPHIIAYAGESRPGDMTVEKVPFDATIKFKKVKGIRMTASDEGVIPSRMHRYASDMRVFSAKGRRRTSSAVLVDVSGSMGLSAAEITQIVKQSPASIVAIYSAHGSIGGVRIVAEKGRFYTKVNHGMGRSNVIDLPALEWLAKRPEKKKIWVSDGQVTGRGDAMLSGIYLRKIVNIMRNAKIARIDNIRELLESGQLIDGSFDDSKAIDERNLAKIVDTKSGVRLDLKERY